MKQKIDRITRSKRIGRKKILVAGYERLSKKEKMEASKVISVLRTAGYNVEKV